MQSPAVLIIAVLVTLFIVPIPADSRSLEATLVLILLRDAKRTNPKGSHSHAST